MAGKAKQKQYQYASAEDGHKYLRSYNSLFEVFEKYYEGKKGELYNNKPYKELPDGTFVANTRIGREGLRKAIREQEDPLNWKKEGDKVIELFNSKGEKIGELLNHRVLKSIMNIKGEQHNNYIGKLKTKRFGVPEFIYKASKEDLVS